MIDELSKYCKEFQFLVVKGNVSLYNTTDDVSIMTSFIIKKIILKRLNL